MNLDPISPLVPENSGSENAVPNQIGTNPSGETLPIPTLPPHLIDAVIFLINPVLFTNLDPRLKTIPPKWCVTEWPQWPKTGNPPLFSLIQTTQTEIQTPDIAFIWDYVFPKLQPKGFNSLWAGLINVICLVTRLLDSLTSKNLKLTNLTVVIFTDFTERDDPFNFLLAEIRTFRKFCDFHGINVKIPTMGTNVDDFLKDELNGIRRV